jgi:hypothetical protein
MKSKLQIVQDLRKEHVNSHAQREAVDCPFCQRKRDDSICVKYWGHGPALESIVESHRALWVDRGVSIATARTAHQLVPQIVDMVLSKWVTLQVPSTDSPEDYFNDPLVESLFARQKNTDDEE